MMDSFNNQILKDPFDASLPEMPYPGLRPFYSSEWPIFFGREMITDEIISLLVKKHFIVVHGDSGSGKSSVVRAGVLVQLQQSHTANGQNWQTCTILPRNNPLDRLAEALVIFINKKPNINQIAEVRKILNKGKFAPVLLSTLLLKTNQDHICILVDQFEEIFRFAQEHNHHEAQVFIDVLTGISTGKIPGMYAILTMRSEFLGYCSRFYGLAEAFNSTQYLLPHIDQDALRRAIQEPARLFGGEVSLKLAQNIIIDVKGNQDELPLIQHGLRKLWIRQKYATEINQPEHKPCLDINDLKIAQNLETMLDRHASSIQSDLLKRNSKIGGLIEHVFRSLTDINTDGKAMRRPISYGRLKYETGSNDKDLHEVLNAFRVEGVNFITPYGSNKIDNNDIIDISHEAFIRSWSQLSDPKEGWLWKEFNAGLTWRALQFQAERFKENPKDRLSRIAFIERAKWVLSLPSPYWCERYGNGRDKVAKLFSSLNYRTSRIFSLIFIIFCLPLIFSSYNLLFNPTLESVSVFSWLLLFGLPAYFFTRNWILGRKARLLVKKFLITNIDKS